MGATIVGGVFLVIAVMGSCYFPRDYPDPVPDAGVDLIDGSQVDGMQVCLDWCTLSKQLCAGPPADTDCPAYCEVQFGNATAQCKNELSAMYACYQQGVESPGDGGDPCLLSCQVYQLAAASCIWEHGCIPGWCESKTRPDGGQECSCDQFCRDAFHESNCWQTGTMSSACECTINDTLPDGGTVGICTGGAEVFCDPSLRKGCCNDFFKL